MGRKSSLSDTEKNLITQELSKGKTTLDISKILGRCHQTVKKFVANPTKIRQRADKGKPRAITPRSMSRIKREAMKNPGLTSQELFSRIGEPSVPRSTRCRYLKKIALPTKAVSKPPLKQNHIENRLKWAEDNMKVDFSKVLFTDETRATLDGPDGWCKGWVIIGQNRHQRLRRQQGGGGIMIWAGIIGGTLVGPWRVPDGVKMTAVAYINFLKEHLEPWLKKQRVTFRRNIVFMQDNAPSHAAHTTTEYLQQLGFTGVRKMKWPANSPDLNPIENLWSIMKQRLYANNRQFKSKDELWNALLEISRDITADDIQKLTNSMDRRLFEVISKRGKHISY